MWDDIPSGVFLTAAHPLHSLSPQLHFNVTLVFEYCSIVIPLFFRYLVSNSICVISYPYILTTDIWQGVSQLPRHTIIHCPLAFPFFAFEPSGFKN